MGLNIGDKAIEFTLKNANSALGGDELSYAEIAGENGTVVVFECNHCPYVGASCSRMDAMSQRCKGAGIGYVGINSNDPEVYADDSFDNMVKRANKGMVYPYLHDATQEIATSYGAKRTPEFFLFNGEGELVYKGRMDDNPRNPMEVSSHELSDAIDAMLAGDVPAVQETESIGCSVKWKA